MWSLSNTSIAKLSSMDLTMGGGMKFSSSGKWSNSRLMGQHPTKLSLGDAPQHRVKGLALPFGAVGWKFFCVGNEHDGVFASDRAVLWKLRRATFLRKFFFLAAVLADVFTRAKFDLDDARFDWDPPFLKEVKDEITTTGVYQKKSSIDRSAVKGSWMQVTDTPLIVEKKD